MTILNRLVILTGMVVGFAGLVTNQILVIAAGIFLMLAAIVNNLR